MRLFFRILQDANFRKKVQQIVIEELKKYKHTEEAIEAIAKGEIQKAQILIETNFGDIILELYPMIFQRIV